MIYELFQCKIITETNEVFTGPYVKKVDKSDPKYIKLEFEPMEIELPSPTKEIIVFDENDNAINRVNVILRLRKGDSFNLSFSYGV
jgi:hypothetical protein